MRLKMSPDKSTVKHVLRFLRLAPTQLSAMEEVLGSMDHAVVERLFNELEAASYDVKNVLREEMFNLAASHPSGMTSIRCVAVLNVVSVFRTFGLADHMAHLASGEILREVRDYLSSGLWWNLSYERFAELSAPVAFVKCLDYKGHPTSQQLMWIGAHLEQLAPYAHLIRERASWDREFLEELLESKAPSLTSGML